MEPSAPASGSGDNGYLLLNPTTLPASPLSVASGFAADAGDADGETDCPGGAGGSAESEVDSDCVK